MMFSNDNHFHELEQTCTGNVTLIRLIFLSFTQKMINHKTKMMIRKKNDITNEEVLLAIFFPSFYQYDNNIYSIYIYISSVLFR